MGREPAGLTPAQKAEHSLQTTYRARLWTPFIAAVKRYRLVEAGDRIAVCVSGGKDSMLLAKLMQELGRHSAVPFGLEFLCMDPGYAPENRALIEQNAARLGVPLRFFETDVFSRAETGGPSPCYRCARMRRGHLYKQAQALGCNKIALGHHFDDVVETTLIALFYGSQLQAMPPRLHSKNFAGMQLIRPLYCVRENDIIAWQRYNGPTFLRCACRFTAAEANGQSGKRQEVKQLLRTLHAANPNVEQSIFNAIHAVCLDTFPGYSARGEKHTLLEAFPPAGPPPCGA